MGPKDPSRPEWTQLRKKNKWPWTFCTDSSCFCPECGKGEEEEKGLLLLYLLSPTVESLPWSQAEKGNKSISRPSLSLHLYVLRTRPHVSLRTWQSVMSAALCKHTTTTNPFHAMKITTSASISEKKPPSIGHSCWVPKTPYFFSYVTFGCSKWGSPKSAPAHPLLFPTTVKKPPYSSHPTQREPLSLSPPNPPLFWAERERKRRKRGGHPHSISHFTSH